MRHPVFFALCVTSQVALAQVVTNVGEVIVVQDTTGGITSLIAGDPGPNIYPSVQEQFCRAAYNAVRASAHPDVYDGIISFSTSGEINDIMNVWQGSPVRPAGGGIGRDTVNFQTDKYNSNRISQCVFMGTLGKTKGFIPGLAVEPLPSNPDSPWRPSIGVPIPIDSETGIEMMGHEYGHHWLMGITYDLNDGKGKRHLLRGTQSNGGGEGGGETMGTPNQHYSALADSRSVMYGSCITPLGNGQYHQAGCVRKYNHIDQYLMGLRGADEISPMLVLEDPSDPGNGVDSVAMAANSSGKDVSGTPYMVTGDSILRAMGPRVPAYPAAKHCWRMAFVVVLAPGETQISPTMYAKVERYRARWSEWFGFATDGRGTMDSRALGDICIDGYRTDGGVYSYPDAGQPVADGGTAVVPDAGMVVEPGTDGGMVVVMLPDGGIECTGNLCEIAKIKPGCGCGSASGLELFGLLGLLALAVRRLRAGA